MSDYIGLAINPKTNKEEEAYFVSGLDGSTLKPQSYVRFADDTTYLRSEVKVIEHEPKDGEDDNARTSNYKGRADEFYGISGADLDREVSESIAENSRNRKKIERNYKFMKKTKNEN